MKIRKSKRNFCQCHRLLSRTLLLRKDWSEKRSFISIWKNGIFLPFQRRCNKWSTCSRVAWLFRTSSPDTEPSPCRLRPEAFWARIDLETYFDVGGQRNHHRYRRETKVLRYRHCPHPLRRHLTWQHVRTCLTCTCVRKVHNMFRIFPGRWGAALINKTASF